MSLVILKLRIIALFEFFLNIMAPFGHGVRHRQEGTRLHAQRGFRDLRMGHPAHNVNATPPAWRLRTNFRAKGFLSCFGQRLRHLHSRRPMNELVMRFPGWRTAFLAPQLGVALAIGLTQAGLSGKDAAYSPPRGSWEHRLPETCGMDSGRLRDAIEF